MINIEFFHDVICSFCFSKDDGIALNKLQTLQTDDTSGSCSCRW